MNFTGDGNCYLRALSICLFGHERGHMALRQVIMRQLSTASSILAGFIVTDDDLQNEVICTHLVQLKKCGTWVRENIIDAAISLQSNFHVYTGCGINSPIVYHAPYIDAITKSNILLSYYEPGHYIAVIFRPSGNGIPLLSDLSPNVLPIVPMDKTSNFRPGQGDNRPGNLEPRHVQPIKGKTFTMLHFNSRSMKQNFQDISEEL